MRGLFQRLDSGHRPRARAQTPATRRTSLAEQPTHRSRTQGGIQNGVCGASRDVQKVQKVSRRCPEGVQKMSRRCPEGWKRMWERLEGPLQVCRRPQVFYRRSHSVRLSRRSHVSQRVASTESWAMKSRHCGLLVKACGPSGHSGHLLKLAEAPSGHSGHLLKLAKHHSGHSGQSGQLARITRAEGRVGKIL